MQHPPRGAGLGLTRGAGHRGGRATLKGRHTMKGAAKLALVVAVALVPPVCMARGQSVVACSAAAFSPHGDFVGVAIIGGTLSVLVTRADGTQQSGHTAVETDQYGGVDCSVFVGSDGKLAVVVTRVPGEDPDSVRMWDLAAAKWRSSFKVAPRMGLEGRIRVRGFWKGGHDLAVESDKLLDGRGIKQTFALALVDTTGSVVAGPRVEKPVGALDAERGALWIDVPGSATDCFRSAATFTGNSLTAVGVQTDTPRIPRSCFAGGLHGFAAGGSPVGAEGEHDGIGTRVWSCGPAGNLQKLSVPSPRKQFLDRWVESGPAALEVSPHGKFFAVNVQVTRWSHFNTQRAEWNELHVFQVAPFREIRKIGPRKGCSPGGFAVGDTDGKARVAANWCGKWVVETVSDTATERSH